MTLVFKSKFGFSTFLFDLFLFSIHPTQWFSYSNKYVWNLKILANLSESITESAMKTRDTPNFAKFLASGAISTTFYQ